MFLLHELLPSRLATIWRLLSSLTFRDIFFVHLRTKRTKITRKHYSWRCFFFYLTTSSSSVLMSNFPNKKNSKNILCSLIKFIFGQIQVAMIDLYLIFTNVLILIIKPCSTKSKKIIRRDNHF